jgi:DNA-binding transcriptional LysR family regulator
MRPQGGAVPRLVEFQQAFPNILVDLHCAMHSADVLRHEADVAIHLSKPTALDVKLVRLGRMHVMFFASQKYIETFGEPKTYDELTKHRIVSSSPTRLPPRKSSKAGFPASRSRTCW